MPKTLLTVFKTAFHRYSGIVVFAVLGMVIGAYLTHTLLEFQGTRHTQQIEQTVMATSTSFYARSAPTRLRIEKIDLDAGFEAPLGLNNDQTIEVPKLYTTVGWYKNGATPGEVGTAVVLGHVDSYQGPAIFYSLSKLEKGDIVLIEREDGTTTTFAVDEIGRYSRENFPTERVYGQTATPTLRLITCTGTFDKDKQQYSHNLVVYASLVDAD